MRLTRRASVNRIVWPIVGLLSGVFQMRRSAAAPQWPLSIFAVPECALELGELALMKRCESACESAATILQRWNHDCPTLAVTWRAKDKKALKAALSSTVKQDFAVSRTMIVDGWVLAQTEAELFALFALDQQAVHETRLPVS